MLTGASDVMDESRLQANATLGNELDDARSQSTTANEQVLALTRDLGMVQAKLQAVTEEVAQLKLERDTLTVDKGAAVKRCEAVERDFEAHKNEVNILTSRNPPHS